MGAPVSTYIDVDSLRTKDETKKCVNNAMCIKLIGSSDKCLAQIRQEAAPEQSKVLRQNMCTTSSPLLHQAEPLRTRQAKGLLNLKILRAMLSAVWYTKPFDFLNLAAIPRLSLKQICR